MAIEPTDKKADIIKPEEFRDANQFFTNALIDNSINKAIGHYGTKVLVNRWSTFFMKLREL